MRLVVVLVSFSLVSLAACSGSHTVDLPDCECTDGETCVDGRCAASCALPSELEAALEPELTIVRSFCVELDAGPLAAIATEDGELELVHVGALTTGRETQLTVTQLRSALGESTFAPTGAPCTASFTAPGDSIVTELTSEVALSADATRIAWGLRAEERIGDSRRQVDGAIYVLPRSGCALETTPFHRVESVAFDADDRLLISGHLGGGVWMDGVFAGAQRVWAESSPGSLWRIPTGVLLGTVLGHGVQPTVALSIESLRAGGEIPRALALTTDAGTSRFVYVGARGTVSSELSLDDDGGTFRVFELRSVAVSASSLELGPPIRIASEPFLEAVAIQGSDRFLLRHAGGLVMVE